MPARDPSAPDALIAIVDYGAGNVASVRKAFEHLGARVVVSSDPHVLLAATMVVFPGQGHFGQAMAQLRATGLDQVIRAIVDAGTPFVGICLGLQLLFDGSDEAPGVAGLGLLAGHCVAFVPPRKIPQIGWNRIAVTRRGSPLDKSSGEHFYFVHTYHAVAMDPTVVVAVSDYDGTFTAAVRKNNLFAMQFHPEKSGEAGLELLRACLQPAWRRVPSTVRVRMVRSTDLDEPAVTTKLRVARIKRAGSPLAVTASMPAVTASQLEPKTEDETPC